MFATGALFGHKTAVAYSKLCSILLEKEQARSPCDLNEGLKAKHLVAIVDFICYRDANIYHKDIHGFLPAEKLQPKHLTEKVLDLI